MKSPCGFLTVFRNLMFTIADLLFVKVILSQVNVSTQNGEKPAGRISPKRNDPKNATQHAAQNNVLVSFCHVLEAIS